MARFLLAALILVAVLMSVSSAGVLHFQAERLREQAGAVVERRLSEIAASLRASPGGATERLRGLSAEGMLADILQDADLTDDPASERVALREKAQRGIWDTIKEILKLLEDALALLTEPAFLGDFSFNFDSEIVKGNLSLKEVKVGHLRDVRIEGYQLGHILNLCLGVNIGLPQFYITVSPYDVDVSVQYDTSADGVFRIFGKGPARIEMTNIQIFTDVCVELRKFKVELRNMRMSVEKDSINLQNLLGGGAISDLVSGIATDVLPSVIQEFQTEIMKLVMDYANKFISSILPAPSTVTPSLSKTMENKQIIFA